MYLRHQFETFLYLFVVFLEITSILWTMFFKFKIREKKQHKLDLNFNFRTNAYIFLFISRGLRKQNQVVRDFKRDQKKQRRGPQLK